MAGRARTVALGPPAASQPCKRRKRSRRRGKHDVRSTQERAEDEDARHRRLNVE
eukprot:COSAG06_NODE_7147_length_2610_cov_12.164476_1_plen_53_part_10